MTISAPARRAALLFAAGVLLAGCDRGTPARPATPPSPPPAATAPVAIAPVAALTRTDLLSALANAASRHAAGAPLDTGLVGRTFVLRLPFGCSGPQADGASREGVAHWSWSKDRASLRLTAAPADWTRSPLLLLDGAEPPWEKAEGFWLERPWLLADVCPARPLTAPATADAPIAAPPPPTAAAPMTAGLAVIRSVESSRLGRRDEGGYSFVVRGSGDTPPALPLNGFRLVLEGRFVTFPEGAAVRCTSQGAERPPVCIAAAQVDVVAFEEANGARLSEWRPN